jgi:hypothetical protein
MNTRRLILSSLGYYWRTNVAVVLGVATAVAVLAGALLVGDSVRGSLHDLVLQRLGETDHVVLSAGLLREELVEDLREHPDFPARFDGICPILLMPGFVTVQSGGGRAGQVLVYGVDDRFWRFHGVAARSGPEGREALLSPALARELGVQEGATILVRVERPSDIPLESLHGRKDDLGRTVRATVRAVVPRETMGEFSLQAQQGEIRAVFLPLGLLQQDLDIGRRVNALLVSAKPENMATSAAALEQLVRSEAELEDLGLKLRVLDARQAISLEADGGLIDPPKANAALEAAREMALEPQPIFTYLVNTVRAGDREFPYSLVTALNLPANSDDSSIVLNDWAARDLRARVGDAVTLEYYVWEDPGRLVTRTTEFRVSRVIPIDPRDRDLAPEYPGISESETLQDWDPPFPIDLGRIRAMDEEYWERYRTTPKAFISYAAGERLWQSRYGAMTSIRLAPGPGQPLEEVRRAYAERLRAKMDPLALGLAVRDVRAESLAAASGATDFGEYFVYFSFFLVVSALLLAALFFKLSVEQRSREVGLLRAVGFQPLAVRRLFLWEGFLLSAAGAAVGVLGGIGYAFLMMAGLRTWWVGAVGTTALTLHVSGASLSAGALGGIAASMLCIAVTLRGLSTVSERRLLTDQLAADTLGNPPSGRRSSWVPMAAAGFAALGVLLMGGAAAGLIARAGAFFGGGMALLASCLLLLLSRLAQPGTKALRSQGWRSVARLGLRSATYRPSRSVVSMAMIASATFILISVDAFRREGNVAANDRRSGVGGYSLQVESLLPLVHDPATRQGRESLGLAGFDSVTIEPFRVRPGDDASCLNLYQPKNPRILAPRDSFLEEGRFRFRASLATNDAERANPWLLLRRMEADGAVPVIADQNSARYVLHRELGEDIVIPVGDRSVRLRLVAMLDDSIFQGELLMSEDHFRSLFPEQAGYRFLLIETPPEPRAAIAQALEEALTDFGADVRSTAERLAEFHQVENTYLATFQMLGGLGLLLGTVGLGAVLLRNVLERRRELALLRALGYRQGHFFAMVVAENALLLVSGLLAGSLCALLAIAPVLLEQSGRLPVNSLVLLLSGVLAAGLLTSLVATVAALRSPLLAALRSE